MAPWHHSPSHILDERGAFMVTSGTYGKQHFFGTPDRRTLLMDALFRVAEDSGWLLQAWTIMSNHYHFIALSPPDSSTLRRMVGRLHAATATEINRLDGVVGRKVWFQYWESRITFQGSYYARLNYVHLNSVHHGVVTEATSYPWCSAGWFENTADRSFYRAIMRLKTDSLHVPDSFEVWRG